MNRYRFMTRTSVEVAKDEVKRKVIRVKQQTVKRFGKKSVFSATNKRQAENRRKRRAPRFTDRGVCHLCGFHIEDNAPRFQTLCDRCDAVIRQKERGVDEEVLPRWMLALSVGSVFFALTWMLVNK